MNLDESRISTAQVTITASIPMMKLMTATKVPTPERGSAA